MNVSTMNNRLASAVRFDLTFQSLNYLHVMKIYFTPSSLQSATTIETSRDSFFMRNLSTLKRLHRSLELSLILIPMCDTIN